VLDLKFLDRIFSDRAEVTVDRLGVETILYEPHVRAVIALADSRARHVTDLTVIPKAAGLPTPHKTPAADKDRGDFELA
jgi:hypothetical protein